LAETPYESYPCWAWRDPSDFLCGKQGNPKVTGVLPITLEDATKVVQALLLSGKEYVCVMQLHRKMSKKKVEKVLKEFQGLIFQRPPIRSSVKRRLRTRMIYYIDFLEMQQRNVLFKIGCESGTYIRKICFDIGEALGCGAHMLELRRTRAGSFTEDEDLVTLYDVLRSVDLWKESGDEEGIRKVVLPMERALDLIPKVFIRDSAVAAVCHGANLAAPGVLSLESGIGRGDEIVVYTQKGEAVALARALVSAEQILEMDHGFVAKTIRVLMDRDTYPRMWGEEGDT
jgi:H/ACA ribonucleoprotein complex subunit 4